MYSVYLYSTVQVLVLYIEVLATARLSQFLRVMCQRSTPSPFLDPQLYRNYGVSVASLISRAPIGNLIDGSETLRTFLIR